MATAKDVIDIAESQVGYSRWNDPETGTKYGRWYASMSGNDYYGQSGVPFCAMFVSWCMNQAGASAAGIPGAYCPWIVSAARKEGRAVSKSEGQYGDIILFDWGGDGVADHVGFVISNNGSSFRTVEGNTNNGQVAYRTRAYSTVICVSRPYYDGESSSCTPAPSVDTSNGARLLRKGSHGDDVRRAQQALIDKGYSCGRWGADGDFGSGTYNAVVAFQRNNGLEVDGIIGPNTSALLFGNGVPASSSNNIGVDGQWGRQTTRALQDLFGTGTDGIVSNQLAAYQSKNPGLLSESWQWESSKRGGSAMVKEMQRRLGVTADGYVGPATISALQSHLGTPVDGHISNPSECVRALQSRLNQGQF